MQRIGNIGGDSSHVQPQEWETSDVLKTNDDDDYGDDDLSTFIFNVFIMSINFVVLGGRNNDFVIISIWRGRYVLFMCNASCLPTLYCTGKKHCR